MKKIFLFIILSGCFLSFGCNAKNEKTAKNDRDEAVTDSENTESADEEEEGADLKKAAAAYCNCFEENMSDLSPGIQKIFIKAGKSNDPQKALQSELMKIDDEDERNALLKEFINIPTHQEMKNCTDRLKKKYDIKPKDLKTQRKLLAIVEERGDCEFVEAVLRMTIKKEENKKANAEDPEETN